MERRIHLFFEKIAASLFTLPPIMIGMFSMYAYLVYESQALLINQLPATILGWQRVGAAWFLSIAIHLTILTTAANSKLVHRAFPIVFAFAGYFITTLFFDAWNWAAPSGIKTIQDILVSQLFSLLIAMINYLFVYLFVGKWKELKSQQADKEALQSAKQDATKFKGEVTNAHQTLTILQAQLTKRNEEYSESKHALTKLQQELSRQQRKHEEALQMVAENRMCVTCGYQADTYQQLSRYKRDCELCKKARKQKRSPKAILS